MYPFPLTARGTEWTSNKRIELACKWDVESVRGGIALQATIGAPVFRTQQQDGECQVLTKKKEKEKKHKDFYFFVSLSYPPVVIVEDDTHPWIIRLLAFGLYAKTHSRSSSFLNFFPCAHAQAKWKIPPTNNFLLKCTWFLLLTESHLFLLEFAGKQSLFPNRVEPCINSNV